MNKNPLFDLNHDGDCSCYKPNSNICDCGILRKTIRSSEGNLYGDDDFRIVWSEHLAAIEIGNIERNRARNLETLFRDE